MGLLWSFSQQNRYSYGDQNHNSRKKHGELGIIYTNQYNLNRIIRQDGTADFQQKKRTQGVELELDEDYHKLTNDELCIRFSTSIKFGLTHQAAESRLIENGRNIITHAQPGPLKDNISTHRLSISLAVVRRYLLGGFMKQLWFFFTLSLVCYEPLGSMQGSKPDLTNLWLATVILLLILVQFLINMYHDFSVRSTQSAFNRMLVIRIMVLRQGMNHMIYSDELVVGDIVYIDSGLDVPADLRIIDCIRNNNNRNNEGSLMMDRSALDGTDQPIVGDFMPNLRSKYLNTNNIAFRGTNILSGRGLGLVVATGDDTLMGRINKSTTGSIKNSANALLHERKDNLSNELHRCLNILALMSLTMGIFCLSLWVFWLRITYPTFMTSTIALTNSLSMMVTFLPEGLSFSVTLALAVFARRMVKNQPKALIKDLSTVDAMGGLTTIAADKTGTLTLRKLRITTVQLDHIYRHNEWLPISNTPSFKLLSIILTLCNSINYLDYLDNLNADENKNQCNLDITDIAILRFTKQFIKKNELQLKFKFVDQPNLGPRRTVELPYMISFFQPMTNFNPFPRATINNKLVLIKGAPEILLPRCKHRINEFGKLVDMDPLYLNRLMIDLEIHSRRGERVLMASYAIDTENSLIYVGMIGMIDTPRPDALMMVHKCRQAGVKIIMMTGDHPITACAIANQVGILTNHHPDSLDTLKKTKRFGKSMIDVFTQNNLNNHNNNRYDVIDDRESDEVANRSLIILGRELQKLNKDEWDWILNSNELVFARVTSSQKLRIVKELQDRGHRLGVLGDGVNDAPAIRRALVGLSMGSSCPMVLSASDLILVNNELSAIPQAIANGRRIVANTKSLLHVIPAGSFSETMPFFINLLFGIPLPLSSLYSATLALLTDLLPSVAIMAMEPNTDLMSQPPRDPETDRLIGPWSMIKSFLLIGIPDAILGHVAFFGYMYYVGDIKPLDLMFAFDKWNQPEGYLGKSQSELLELQYTGQSLFYLTFILLQVIKNLLSTHIEWRALLFRRIITLTFTPNIWYILTIAFTLTISNCFFYLPFFNREFNTKPLSLESWVCAISIAVVGVILFEGRTVLAKCI